MDSTCAYFYLLCVPVCRDTFDRMEHGEGWIREKRSTDTDRVTFRVLCTPDFIFPFLTTFEALQ